MLAHQDQKMASGLQDMRQNTFPWRKYLYYYSNFTNVQTVSPDQ